MSGPLNLAIVGGSKQQLSDSFRKKLERLFLLPISHKKGSRFGGSSTFTLPKSTEIIWVVSSSCSHTQNDRAKMEALRLGVPLFFGEHKMSRWNMDMFARAQREAWRRKRENAEPLFTHDSVKPQLSKDKPPMPAPTHSDIYASVKRACVEQQRAPSLSALGDLCRSQGLSIGNVRLLEIRNDVTQELGFVKYRRIWVSPEEKQRLIREQRPKSGRRNPPAPTPLPKPTKSGTGDDFDALVEMTAQLLKAAEAEELRLQQLYQNARKRKLRLLAAHTAMVRNPVPETEQ